MAPQPPPSLDYCRGFFSGAQASIFDAIDAAACRPRRVTASSLLPLVAHLHDLIW
jgi:hypothetical protein